MSDEPAFLQAIAANPRDLAHRLVFSDWLEEHGADRLGQSMRHPYMPGHPHSAAMEDPHDDQRWHDLAAAFHQAGSPVTAALVGRIPGGLKGRKPGPKTGPGSALRAKYVSPRLPLEGMWATIPPTKDWSGTVHGMPLSIERSQSFYDEPGGEQHIATLRGPEGSGVHASTMISMEDAHHLIHHESDQAKIEASRQPGRFSRVNDGSVTEAVTRSDSLGSLLDATEGFYDLQTTPYGDRASWASATGQDWSETVSMIRMAMCDPGEPGICTGSNKREPVRLSMTNVDEIIARALYDVVRAAGGGLSLGMIRNWIQGLR